MLGIWVFGIKSTGQKLKWQCLESSCSAVFNPHKYVETHCNKDHEKLFFEIVYNSA
jgi:hypothetical protein